MKNDNSFLTPISTIFMLIFISPYLWLKFGEYATVIMILLLGISFFNLKKYYSKYLREHNITLKEAIENDLPDMSPVAYLLFALLIAPILIGILGVNIENFIFIVIVWIAYTVYYYFYK